PDELRQHGLRRGAQAPRSGEISGQHQTGQHEPPQRQMQQRMTRPDNGQHGPHHNGNRRRVKRLLHQEMQHAARKTGKACEKSGAHYRFSPLAAALSDSLSSCTRRSSSANSSSLSASLSRNKPSTVPRSRSTTRSAKNRTKRAKPAARE